MRHVLEGDLAVTWWPGRKPNSKFATCAVVARRLLSEAIGCVPGDLIPDEDDLVAAARRVAADDSDRVAQDRALAGLGMIDEIGGL
jgi:hypothetical protein